MLAKASEPHNKFCEEINTDMGGEDGGYCVTLSLICPSVLTSLLFTESTHTLSHKLCNDGISKAAEDVSTEEDSKDPNASAEEIEPVSFLKLMR